MRPLRIMLADLMYFNKHRGWMQVVPINIGFIGQHLNQEFGKDVDVSLYKNPLDFMEALKKTKPDIIGLSLYYWNTDLNRVVIKKIRSLYGNDVIIIHGGPSTDTEDHEQINFLQSHGADALILEEGELPFADIVRTCLSNSNQLFSEPINGAVFLKDQELVGGLMKTVQTDLTNLQSPYLSGILDKFIYSDYLPLVQMSRYCPYSCSFCVSGKTRGKLRAFEMDQIKEEINFISKTYIDRPHFALQVADENFGLLKRDLEIAKHFKKVSDEIGFPQSMFYYSDKKWSETARGVVEALGKINTMGFQISLQSGNEKTLVAVNRKNLSEEEIEEAIIWSSERKIDTFTELIFGMPEETIDSFCDTLDYSAKRGFDSIQAYSLFLMAGIPLNTKVNREKYKIDTKLRVLTSGYGELEGEFSVEHEEIVTSTSTISENDFIKFRKITFMFFAAFRLGFYRWFFQHIQSMEISLSKFFLDFMNPDPEEDWPEDYLKFVSDFDELTKEELFDSREDLIKRAKEIFRENNNQVGIPTRLNVVFGARLAYQESPWLREVMTRHLAKKMTLENDQIDTEIVKLVLDICERERVDLRSPKSNKDQIKIDFDVIAWKNQQYRNLLSTLPCNDSQTLYFNIKPDVLNMIESFTLDYGNQEDADFYYNAVDFILPRSNQLYSLSYEVPNERDLGSSADLKEKYHSKIYDQRPGQNK